MKRNLRHILYATVTYTTAAVRFLNPATSVRFGDAARFIHYRGFVVTYHTESVLFISMPQRRSIALPPHYNSTVTSQCQYDCYGCRTISGTVEMPGVYTLQQIAARHPYMARHSHGHGTENVQYLQDFLLVVHASCDINAVSARCP